ncbi:MAG: hypothetical protein KA987_09530 [Saprospiraceae bacterium]|nr:hypothetical protein [Saprospiraceae bacterium]
MKHTFIDPHEVADTLNRFFLRNFIDLSVEQYADLQINSDNKFFKWNRTDKKRCFSFENINIFSIV